MVYVLSEIINLSEFEKKSLNEKRIDKSQRHNAKAQNVTIQYGLMHIPSFNGNISILRFYIIHKQVKS